VSDVVIDESPEAALRALRRHRQRNRLGELDWFEAAYRVYLLGGFGGGSVLWISSSVKDQTVGDAALADVLAHGPAVLGLVAVLAVMAGLRGGAQGGPLALEAADVVHVMLAPVDRRAALMRPAVQRLRSASFMAVAAGAIAGQLAGRRLPGSLLAWSASGALFGATVAGLWAGSALLAHTSHVRRPIATAVAVALGAWQGAAVAWSVPGPGDTVGSIGLWGWRQHAVDAVPMVVAVVSVVAGVLLLGRLSLDALARRSALVAQLRFAVTMQDLRTVILLRRQLNQEHARHRPWMQVRRGGATGRGLWFTVWRRGWHGLLRFPLSRVVRMTALAAAIGVAQASVVRGTTPAFVVTALLGFVLGLEVMEPLSQEVDQADRADAIPIERGELLARHLFAPAVALVPFGVVAGLAAWLSLGARSDALAPVALLAIPTVLGAATGAVISIVRDAPDPFSSSRTDAFVPPEMAGFTTTIRLVWPIVVSALTTCTVLLVRGAWRSGESLTGAALRGAIGSMLVVLLVGYWVRVRDRVRHAVRKFMEEGRAATAQQKRGVWS